MRSGAGWQCNGLPGLKREDRYRVHHSCHAWCAMSGLHCGLKCKALTMGVGVAVGAAIQPDAVAHHPVDVQGGLEVPEWDIGVDLRRRVACSSMGQSVPAL